MQTAASDRLKKKPIVRVHMTLGDGLWQLLARTDHLIAKARQKELRQFGLTMNDAIVLFTAIRLKRLATPANISRQLFWEPHTTSVQLKAMEKKGLIRRAHDLGRRNMIRVELTDKGLEAYRESSRRKSTRKVMSSLSETEQLQMWDLLVSIRKMAMQELKIELTDPFPPSDPKDL
jgi:DNA-binding MarR family transcriptional regulator